MGVRATFEAVLTILGAIMTSLFKSGTKDYPFLVNRKDNLDIRHVLIHVFLRIDEQRCASLTQDSSPGTKNPPGVDLDMHILYNKRDLASQIII